LIDCSSGGLVSYQKIPVFAGYQVQFAEAVKSGSGMLTAAVGLITEPQQAEDILQESKADLIFLARELLRDPYFPLHAATALNEDVKWPDQYDRAKRKHK
jgi:2,4-dienoyl-CoA reductase-like NADH-dependent reductase (Old Yellow Enzyme family)